MMKIDAHDGFKLDMDQGHLDHNRVMIFITQRDLLDIGKYPDVDVEYPNNGLDGNTLSPIDVSCWNVSG